MLAEHCLTEGCYTPLMENRQGDKAIECVQCKNTYHRTDGEIRLLQAKQPVVPPSKPTLPPTTTPATPVQEVTAAADDDEEEEEDDEVLSALLAEESRRKRDQATKEIGRLLLLRWEMRSDSCWDCLVPFMRHPDQSYDLCVACNKKRPTAQAAAQQPTAPAKASVPKESPIVQPATPVVQSSSTSASSSVHVQQHEQRVKREPLSQPSSSKGPLAEIEDIVGRKMVDTARRLEHDDFSSMEEHRALVGLLGEYVVLYRSVVSPRS